jgi:hypothetical protein
MVGVALENVYIGLALYSGMSTLLIGYSLLWYIRLVKSNPPGDHFSGTFETSNG